MTGIEALREELHKRGFSNQQINSKVFYGTVEAIAGLIDGELLELANVKSEMQKEVEWLQRKKEQLEYDTNTRLEFLKNEFRKMQVYIDSFFNALEACETPEKRDALRTAQMFVNSINIDTKYDNTAYIIGLAGILSGEKFPAIEELKKINTKLPYGSYGLGQYDNLPDD